MEYKNYTVDDLVQNASFRRMVNGTAGAAEINYWSRWMEENEANREKAREAISRVAGFRLVDPLEATPEQDFEGEWTRLYKSTLGQSHSEQLHSFESEGTHTWIYRVAAVLLIGCIAGLGIWLYSLNIRTASPTHQIAQTDTITTPEDHKKTLTFSNGAKIVLNSNSVLTYSISSHGTPTVEVSLKTGEAFFSDKSSTSGGPSEHRVFTVTTPDGIVEDIGTEFVVSVGKSDSRVILQNGQVRIKTINGKNRVRRYDMKKGEMVTLKKTQIIKKEVVNPTFYTAWATGFMQFNHTPVREFARYVENRFGVKVVIANPDLAGVSMDGAVYFKSLESLVQSVSDAAQIPVYQSVNRDTVYIGNLNQKTKHEKDN